MEPMSVGGSGGGGSSWQGIYLINVVSDGLGIYLINLLIVFLFPMVDSKIHALNAGPMLPTGGSDEFKPFIRRLPEFKF